MKKLIRLLLKKYSQMSGDKKIRIAMKLSEVARRARKDGIVVMGD